MTLKAHLYYYYFAIKHKLFSSVLPITPLENYSNKELIADFFYKKYNYPITTYDPSFSLGSITHDFFFYIWLDIQDYCIANYYSFTVSFLVFSIVISIFLHNFSSYKLYFQTFSVRYRKFLINLRNISDFIENTFDNFIELLRFISLLIRSADARHYVAVKLMEKSIFLRRYLILQYRIFMRKEDKSAYIGELIFKEKYSIYEVLFAMIVVYLIFNAIFGKIMVWPYFLRMDKAIWTYKNIHYPDWWLLEKYYQKHEKAYTRKLREYRKIIKYLGTVHRWILIDYRHLDMRNFKNDLAFWIELKRREFVAARKKMMEDFMKQKALSELRVRTNKLNKAIDDAVKNYVTKEVDDVPVDILEKLDPKYYKEWTKAFNEKRQKEAKDFKARFPDQKPIEPSLFKFKDDDKKK
jgi:hypothetical protein